MDNPQSKAEELWRSLLTQAQYERWEELGILDLRAESGTRYRMIKRYYGAWQVVNHPIVRWCCVHCSNPGVLPMPPRDHHIAVLLWLRSDERSILDIAHLSPPNASANFEPSIPFEA